MVKLNSCIISGLIGFVEVIVIKTLSLSLTQWQTWAIFVIPIIFYLVGVYVGVNFNEN